LIIKKNYLLGQAQTQSQSQMQTNELQTVKAAIRYRKTNYKLRIEHNLRENEFYESQLELLTKMKRPESICIITGEKLLDDYLICPDGHCYSLKGIKLMRSYKNDRHILCPYTQRKLFPLMFSKPITKKAWGSKIMQLHNDITYIIGKNYDNENRIIIFSKYEETLKAITAFLEEERYNYICPSGTASQIAIGINKFKTDINIRLLLLCSEKSSAGTNIIEATHIILFDTISINIAKSRAIETQAVARAVRIGQKNHVKVLRYIIKDSIEEELYYSSII
jgi:SNF2 family DNA or RNA helicase